MYREAIDLNSEAIENLKGSLGPGTSSLFEIECMTLVNLGENHLMTGELATAAEFLERVFENSKKPDYYWARARWKPRCLLALGELHLTRGNPGEAQGFLDQAIENGWIEKFPYKKYQVRAQRLQGNILTAQGNLEQAETALKRALKLARELGSPTQLWLTEHALATLYAGLGEGNGDSKSNRKKAAKHYQAALATVQAIARDLTEPRLKEGFLASAPIRQLMAQAEQT